MHALKRRNEQSMRNQLTLKFEIILNRRGAILILKKYYVCFIYEGTHKSLK